MENRTLTKLALISQRARKEPQLQFTSLAHLLDVDFLRGCYFELGRDRASGIDGVSWQEYGKPLEENLANLVVRVDRNDTVNCARIKVGLEFAECIDSYTAPLVPQNI